MFKKIRNSFIKIFDSFEKRRYKKSILYFYDPKIENDRIAQDLDGLTEYDLTNEKFELGGRLKKRFVMIDKKNIEEYLNAVKQSETSYRTYLEEEDIKKDEIPTKIGVLLKYTTESHVYSEVVGSQIMNFFGVDTVYNFVIPTLKIHYVASIDFIKPNEKFISLKEYDLNESFCTGLNLYKIEAKIRTILNKIKMNEFVFANHKEIDKIVEDYIYMSVIKRYILGDFDVKSENFGVIIKNHKISLAPAFDFDTSFLKNLSSERDLQLLKKYHPKSYEKFKEKFYKFIEKDKEDVPFYETMIESLVNIDFRRENILEELDKNIEDVQKTIKNIELEKFNI